MKNENVKVVIKQKEFQEWLSKALMKALSKVDITKLDWFTVKNLPNESD